MWAISRRLVSILRERGREVYRCYVPVGRDVDVE